MINESLFRLRTQAKKLLALGLDVVFLLDNRLQVTREGGDIRLFITLVSRVLYYIRWFSIFGDFINLSVLIFQPLNVIYRRGHFVY